MRVRAWVAGLMAAGVAGVGAMRLPAQTHKVETPQAVVRAVGVYEWTGEMKSPKASRLVPVTVFIDGELHDAGVYEPRPIPFALEPGVEYEVQRGGAPQGLLVLETVRHHTADDNGEGDMWSAFGRYTTQAVKAPTPLRVSKNVPVILSSKDDDAKAAQAQTGQAKSGSGGWDEGRPTMRRRGQPSTGTTQQPSTTTTQPSSTSGDSQTASGDAGGDDHGTNASGDVDRPTLKRRTPAEDKKARKKADQPSVTARGGPADDPDRPVLHRGGASDLGESAGVPELLGTPADLQQAVAVSDAATRPEHEYARPWSDDAERAAVLAKMQTLARKQLAAYKSAASTQEMSAAAAGVDADPGRPELRRGATASSRTGTAGSGAASVKRSGAAATRTGSRTSKTATTAPVAALADEQVKGFTLSYGAQPVYVYTARTAGDEKTARYVTVVTEQDVSGELRPVLQSVTDAGHLDRTPWMRLVDAVDAEASNRASLLFELRYANSRSFALYRVLGASATQLATTGGM